MKKQVIVLWQWEVPNNKQYSPRHTPQKFIRTVTKVHDGYHTSCGMAKVNGEFIPVYLDREVWRRLWLEKGQPTFLPVSYDKPS